MARKNTLDVTTIYRFKTTHVFTPDRNGWGLKVGEPAEVVEFIGPYLRKVPFQSWVPQKGTFEVERQKLEAVTYKESGMIRPRLEWQTVETKRYEDGEPVL